LQVSTRSRGIGDLQDQAGEQGRAESKDSGVVFSTAVGTELDAANVRRAFRRGAKAAGLDPADWMPCGRRHNFVSLLSDGGMSIEHIADLGGHSSGTTVTEKAYRLQLRPVLLKGSVAMDESSPSPPKEPEPPAATKPALDAENPRASHSNSYTEGQRGHIHRWGMPSDLVGDNWV
jgi:Phage integrase family